MESETEDWELNFLVNIVFSQGRKMWGEQNKQNKRTEWSRCTLLKKRGVFFIDIVFLKKLSSREVFLRWMNILILFPLECREGSESSAICRWRIQDKSSRSQTKCLTAGRFRTVETCNWAGESIGRFNKHALPRSTALSSDSKRCIFSWGR